MQDRPIRTLKMILGALFVLGLLSYTAYETRDIIRGPIISVTNPQTGYVATSSVVQLSGNAQNISYLSFNGKSIYVDIAGDFREKLLVPEGYTILELRATDRFNREAVRHIRIIRQEEANS